VLSIRKSAESAADVTGDRRFEEGGTSWSGVAGRAPWMSSFSVMRWLENHAGELSFLSFAPTLEHSSTNSPAFHKHLGFICKYFDMSA